MQIIQSPAAISWPACPRPAPRVFSAPEGSLADEAPLETTAVRLIKIPGICIAPQYVAEELLRAEGFTEVRYVVSEAGRARRS